MRVAILVLILLFSSPLAAASSYYAVIQSDGPTSDVVNAANFAANMKARAGVSFTGITEDDVEYENGDSIYVWFDGPSAHIESSSGMEDVRDTAETYLTDQGFSVTTAPLKQDRTPSRPAAVPQETVEDTGKVVLPKIDDEVLVGEDPPTNPLDDADQIDETGSPDDSASEGRPNVLVRAWHWFVGLFS